MRLILAHLVNFCWFCFKWGLVLAAIGIVVAVPYLYHRVDEEIRCRVVDEFAKHYGDLKVTIRSAELVEGEGIEVRGLSIVDPAADGPRAELVYFDEVRLSCSTDLQELIGSEPTVTHVTICRPTFRATRLADGTWSIAKLLPLPHNGPQPPAVTIENGTIEICDPLKNPASTLTLRDVNLTLIPADTADAADTAGQGGKSPQLRRLQGTFSADHLRRVKVEGWIDPRQHSLSASGRVEGLDVSPELRDMLPEPLAERLAVLGELRGRAALGFRLDYDPSAESPYRFDVSGRLTQGRIDDGRLPYPLTDVDTTFRLTNEGFAVRELVASSGQATLWMEAQQQGLAPGSPLKLQAKIEKLELDRRLFEGLPDSLRAQWNKYRPAGQIDALANLSYDGQTWRGDLSVECLNVSFEHHKFPYRLERGTGRVQWRDDLLTLDMTAYSGSQPVQLDAEVLHPTAGPTAWTGWLAATGNQVQFDEKLLAAMTPKPQAVVRSLDPRGTFDFRWRISRDVPEAPLHKELVVALNRCSARYSKFAYPLGNIRGTLVMRDDQWTFHDLEGTNDTGRVTCQGYLQAPQQGQELFLRFAAADLPLEEELRDALSPNMQRVWNDLKPQGMVNLQADVRYLPETKKLNVNVRLEPQGDTASIEPVHFPYRMEKLRGVLEYHDGHVSFERLRAEHGPVTLTAAGHSNLLPDGRWDFHLQGLSIDRLHLEDRDVIRAVPERLKKAILELKPTGPVNLRGSFDLEGGPKEGDPVRARWDLAIGFHQGGLVCGVTLRNVSGSMTLAGGFNGRHFHSRGELDIDSLTYDNYQLTEFRGPLWIDDRQVLLGSWVDRRNEGAVSEASRHKPRPLSAKLFGGTLYGDGWVSLGPQPRYGLQATLVQADLKTWAQEVIVGRQNLRGTIEARVTLGGTGSSRNGMGGHGTIRLRDADVYELPVMIALLKILSIRPPDQTAFSKSDIDFRIQGEHIYFDRINFNGDAISLLGQGEMDFQSNVALNFHAIVGNDEFRVPILRELMGEASKQTMQIRVGGTLQDPDTRTEAIPGVTKILDRLQSDLQKGAPPQGLLPEARQWMPPAGQGRRVLR